MGLSKTGASYFENLVYFNQAKNFSERDHYFEKLNSLPTPTAESSAARKLRNDQYELYANWYHAAIRSLIDLYPKISGDYAALAKMVYPAIKTSQAKKSVELLVRLGLITRKNNHAYKINDARLTTGEEVQSLAVQRFHIDTMKLAEQAIKRLPKDKRNISGLTLGISQETYEKVRKLIYECQKKIMDVADKDEKADRVYQVNFHAFPVSRV
jgi:uncharacterized protein (TIGR02147 family)